MDRWKRLLFAGCAFALLAFAYERTTAQGVMTNAARAYLNALTPELKARSVFPLDSDERLNWHFVPIERKGVALRELTSAQKHLAEALLSAGLSQQGVIKAHTIMSLDQILKDMEKGTGPERDPEKYYVSILGEPSEQGVWAYRFEGHHISLNFTIVNGRIASSPSFFGANPADVKEGPRAGLRAMMREEDLGRALVQSLDASQREIAVVDKTAPKDILTFDSRKAALNGQPSGLPFSKMTARQKDLLSDLVSEYATNFPPQIADFRLDQYRKAQAKLFFAWAGGTDKGQPHYYRVQTPVFLIEYDNTQNDANHIHSVCAISTAISVGICWRSIIRPAIDNPKKRAAPGSPWSCGTCRDRRQSTAAYSRILKNTGNGPAADERRLKTNNLSAFICVYPRPILPFSGAC